MSAVYENQASDFYCRGGKNYKSKLQCSPHLHYHIEFVQLLEGETVGYADTEETPDPYWPASREYFLVKAVNIKLSWHEALSLTMRGYFCSIIIPGGAIGGDLAKIGMIAHGMNKGERFEPGLSILIDRIVGMIALFGTAIILMLLDFRTLLKIDLSAAGIAPKFNIYLILLVMLLCFAGIAAASVLFAWNFIEKIPIFKLLFYLSRQRLFKESNLF